MASFTDNPQLLTNFNPYVQQLPIDAMREVGMYKQAKYDEGVQKIQTTIDNVAGLDVIRDVDKGYLQSKLNELGNNLKSVAGGDFSNFQLVNSTAGMATKIAKDSTVQNAVMSTAKYRKEVAFMDSERQAGKLAVENEWDFKNGANKWLNSDNLEEGFNGKYQTYIDVNKKWMEVMKTLHSDLTEQDITNATTLNADGSVNRKETLKAMQRLSKETVSSAKIENALRSSLTPDDLNQLSISGRYEFRNYDTPEKLAVYSKTRFDEQIKINDKRIEELTGLRNLNTSNSETQKKAQSIIDSLANKNKELEGQLNNELEAIKTNPDQAKAFIYKNGAIEQFANSYAWEHNKENVMSNPELESDHWEKTHALAISQFNLSKRSQTWKEYADTVGWKYEQAKLDLATQKQMAELYGTGTPFETYLGQNTNIKDPMSAMIEDEASYSQAASTGIIEMVRGIKGTNSVQIKNAIEKYKNGDPNWYKLGNSSSVKAIPIEWRDEVDAIIENQNEAKSLNIGRTNIIKEVENSPEFKNSKANVYEKVKGVKPITIKDASGKTITYTSKELADYAIKESMTKSPFNSKEQALFNFTHRKGIVRGATDARLDNAFTEVRRAVTPIEKAKQKAIATKIAERTGIYVPRLTTINFSSEDGNIARQKWESIADAVLSRYEGKGGDEKLSKDDVATGKGWISGEGKSNIVYKKLTQGNKTYLVMNKGGEEITIPLESREAVQLPLRDQNEPSQEYQKIVKRQQMFNGSTNPTGNYQDAMFGKSILRNSGLDIKADLTSNKSNSAKQYVMLRLNTPNGVISLQLENNPMTRDQAVPFLNKLTKAQIKQLYLNSHDVSDHDKQLIKNL